MVRGVAPPGAVCWTVARITGVCGPSSRRDWHLALASHHLMSDSRKTGLEKEIEKTESLSPPEIFSE